MPLPPLARFLDPRSRSLAAERPIGNSVNIPTEEIQARIHELPSKHGKVWVAGSEPFAAAAVQKLAAGGREAEAAANWVYGDSGPARLWSPNEFLLGVAESLSPGRALELACGTGRDAVTLAALGWQVTAIDHLGDALARGRDLSRRYLPAEAQRLISWVEMDLEPPYLPAEWKGGFDLVSMAWYLNRDLLRLAPDLLRQGGSLVVETFTEVHRARFGKPRTEAFALSLGELRDLAGGLDVRLLDEDWHGDRHSARLHALKATQPP